MIYISDGTEEEQALARITYLCIAAHQDDIEFMAYAPIAECFGSKDKWFGAIIVTDGAGSPRSGLYADYTDEQMKEVRIVEQKKAATVGEYGFLAMLSHPSREVKDAGNTKIIEELAELIREAKQYCGLTVTILNAWGACVVGRAIWWRMSCGVSRSIPIRAFWKRFRDWR